MDSQKIELYKFFNIDENISSSDSDYFADADSSYKSINTEYFDTLYNDDDDDIVNIYSDEGSIDENKEEKEEKDKKDELIKEMGNIIDKSVKNVINKEKKGINNKINNIKIINSVGNIFDSLK